MPTGHPENFPHVNLLETHPHPPPTLTLNFLLWRTGMEFNSLSTPLLVLLSSYIIPAYAWEEKTKNKHAIITYGLDP